MLRLPRAPFAVRSLSPRQRAALYAFGLLLLYSAVALRPSAPAPHAASAPPARTSPRLPGGLQPGGVRSDAPPATSPRTGGVPAATRRVPAVTARGPRLLSVGNVLALLVLGGGGAYALYLRRRPGAPGGSAAPLHALGGLGLGPGAGVRLVRCGGDVLLLGVTAHGVTLLQRYDAADYERAAAPADPAPFAPAPALRGPSPVEPTAAVLPSAPPASEATSAFAPLLADALRHAPGAPASGVGSTRPLPHGDGAPAARAWRGAAVLPPVAPLRPLGPLAPHADA